MPWTGRITGGHRGCCLFQLRPGRYRAKAIKRVIPAVMQQVVPASAGGWWGERSRNPLFGEALAGYLYQGPRESHRIDLTLVP
jgi:hypothetical protein